MKNVLSKTKYALMTSGLGNIYDTASYNIPTVWLPPANDSQGQQLKLLTKANMIDGQFNFTEQTINYNDNQIDVLKIIADTIATADTDNLIRKITTEINKIKDKDNSKTTQLLDTFGYNGAEAVVEKFLNLFYERKTNRSFWGGKSVVTDLERN